MRVGRRLTVLFMLICLAVIPASGQKGGHRRSSGGGSSSHSAGHSGQAPRVYHAPRSSAPKIHAAPKAKAAPKSKAPKSAIAKPRTSAKPRATPPKAYAPQQKARVPSSSKAPGAVPRDKNGRIARSEGAKKSFEKQTGHPNGWPGHVVDHIVPLACGGVDAPSNMQWQTTAEGKAKDVTERKGCGKGK